MVYIHSTNGFVSTAWGPALWYLLHTLSFRVDTDRRNFEAWFLLLEHVLPCGACRGNFPRNLHDAGYTPTSTFRSMRSTSMFLWRFHKTVNSSLHKSNTLSYSQVKQRYQCGQARNVVVTINGEPWDSGLDCSGDSQGCFFLHTWCFLLMIIALNFPIEVHSPRAASYYPWLVKYISLLPSGKLRRRIEHVLLLALDGDSRTWTRSYFVTAVVQCLDICMFTCSTMSGMLQRFETLRATTCSQNTLASEGTCTRSSDVIRCIVERNSDENL
jgi:hypothetical protein